MSLVPPMAGYPVLLDAAGALQTRLRLKQCKSLFGSLSGARLRANGKSPICPAEPHRRGREKTQKLSEGEARVFLRPALVEK